MLLKVRNIILPTDSSPPHTFATEPAQISTGIVLAMLVATARGILYSSIRACQLIEKDLWDLLSPGQVLGPGIVYAPQILAGFAFYSGDIHGSVH